MGSGTGAAGTPGRVAEQGGAPRPSASPAARPDVSLRAIVLPAEHGAWGFLAEPLVLGLAIAPSRAAALLAAAAVLAFLARQPLRLSIADLCRARTAPRTRWAAGAAAVLGLGAAATFAAALAEAAPGCWIPLVAALPLLGIQLAYDIANRGHVPAAELAGAAGSGALAAALARAGGASASFAWTLWILMAARAVPSVLYVRARIRLERGVGGGATLARAAHLAALAVASALAVLGRGPLLAVAATGLLLARCVHGLSARRQRIRTRVVGLQEIGWGALYVAALVASR